MDKSCITPLAIEDKNQQVGHGVLDKKVNYI